MMKKPSIDTKGRTLILVGIIGWSLLAYQNCAPEESSGRSTLSSVGPGTLTIDNGVDLKDLPDLKPVGVDYSENLILSMQNQTGTQTLSGAQTNLIRNWLTMVPESGRAASVTAPMWIAVTNSSGEVCTSLIAQEKALASASRRYFGMIDFTKGPNMISDPAKNDVIRRLARNIWARNESAQELIDIRNALNESFASVTQAAQTDNAMIFVCSAMLASLDARKH